MAASMQQQPAIQAKPLTRYTLVNPQTLHLTNISLRNDHRLHPTRTDLEHCDTLLDYSVHTCPALLKRELCNILPDFKPYLQPTSTDSTMHCIITIQRSECSLLEYTKDSEDEKNRLLQCFYRFAHSICRQLLQLNTETENHNIDGGNHQASRRRSLAGSQPPIGMGCFSPSHGRNSLKQRQELEASHKSDTAMNEMHESKEQPVTIPRHIVADYIDPCTGQPVLTTSGGAVYSEVDGCSTLLRYTAENIGCCSLLHHPRWHAACYPASIFTNASLQQINAAIEQTCKELGMVDP